MSLKHAQSQSIPRLILRLHRHKPFDHIEGYKVSLRIAGEQAETINVFECAWYSRKRKRRITVQLKCLGNIDSVTPSKIAEIRVQPAYLAFSIRAPQ